MTRDALTHKLPLAAIKQEAKRKMYDMYQAKECNCCHIFVKYVASVTMREQQKPAIRQFEAKQKT